MSVNNYVYRFLYNASYAIVPYIELCFGVALSWDPLHVYILGYMIKKQTLITLFLSYIPPRATSLKVSIPPVSSGFLRKGLS